MRKLWISILFASLLLTCFWLSAAAQEDQTVYLPFIRNVVSTPTPPPTATPPPTSTPVSPDPGNCDPSYPTVCIPPPPPDLDCDDIPYRRFPVVGSDPHRFDGDNDGIGCES